MNIALDSIDFSIGDNKIVKQITATILSNEFVGIIGPNGSGKSTLLKCMYRVLEPENGAVFLDGRRITTMSLQATAKKMAVLAQHMDASFDFTVEEIVRMGRAPYKKWLDFDTQDDRKIIRQALQHVGLINMEQRKLSTLSGGEQQRALLARALAQKTPCLILDEPTNHLDIKHQLELMQLVKTIGCTTIAAIHDLNIAALYCDRIIALKEGEILGNGPTNELLTADFISKLYDVAVEVNVNPRTGRKNIMYFTPNESAISMERQ